MTAGEPSSVGPLQVDVIRLARTSARVWFWICAPLTVFLLLVYLALLPEFAAGLGFAHRVSATVVSVEPMAEARSCSSLQQITYTWGGGDTGTAEHCHSASGGDPKVGAEAVIWVLPGWDDVVASHGISDALSVIGAIVVLVLLGWCTVHYRRQLHLLRAVQRRAIPCRSFTAELGDAYVGPQQIAQLRLDFRGGAYRSMTITPPAIVASARTWNEARVYSLRRTMRGRPGGPFVIWPSDGRAKPFTVLRRALRPAPGADAPGPG